MNPINSDPPVLSSESELLFRSRRPDILCCHSNDKFPLVPPRCQGSEGQLRLVQGKYPLSHLQHTFIFMSHLRRPQPERL